MENRKILVGNSYEIREEIKQKGGKWDGEFWSVPESVYDEIQNKLGKIEFLFESRMERGVCSKTGNKNYCIHKVYSHELLKKFFVETLYHTGDEIWSRRNNLYGFYTTIDLLDTEEKQDILENIWTNLGARDEKV